MSVGFQGETKKALLELSPLRWDEASGQLLLARRLIVRVVFKGRERGETILGGSRGRRVRKQAASRQPRGLVRLETVEPGLYRVRFEDIFGSRSRRGIKTSSLSLTRQGEPVAFHVEPSSISQLGPGSSLYFVSEGAAANAHGDLAVYELSAGGGGVRMSERVTHPSGSETEFYWRQVELEHNRTYQAGLVQAPDRWLWDALYAPALGSYPFTLSSLANVRESSLLEVWLQGATDLPADPDHHVRLYVNGSLVAEEWWDGKKPLQVRAELTPGVLVEGANLLEIDNVRDTEANYSMVMLNRFRVSYPRRLEAEAGVLEGKWSTSGAAEVSGLSGEAHLLDVSTSAPQWLKSHEGSREGTVRFRAEQGHRYLLVDSAAVRQPSIVRPVRTNLSARHHRADYLVLGPAELLAAARPLLELRRSQGLRVMAVTLDSIYSEFAHGESHPEAIRDFLAYAYHHWRTPSPRYVLLLGDATYDFKDYLGTGVANQVPPLMVETRYLWTVSDPAYAAVNGEDLLPDLAIGRLPAANAEQARVMAEKIVRYETGSASMRGRAVLVADNADGAGDFPADADIIAERLSMSRDVSKIYLNELGAAAMRSAIVKAFDEGASVMSYVGHGGLTLWATENVLNRSQVSSFAPQTQQPLLFTMNCLNGYFHFPFFNSLSEELLKAEGRGVIAAFSPSGLSLNGPAGQFHQALIDALEMGGHERLGDAVMAAQAAYADSGAFPELLLIYQLLGDPALTLR